MRPFLCNTKQTLCEVLIAASPRQDSCSRRLFARGVRSAQAGRQKLRVSRYSITVRAKGVGVWGLYT